ncbi:MULTISPECIES: response regulator [Pseudomonas]|uniref:response regulator n=1 Tax=Pseudomonas TaxID=286 RepID=UPI0005FAE12C|nr:MULTISPECIES: response regulator [Pseudomonas]KJZ55610.1 response regulator [Pseudomonas marginalis]KJZ61532.1 response regulator [Pseudomonas marginalis]PLR64066.1 response regulator [Pseudomonas sp. QC2]WPN26449.1 response regulator [Pseudomonas marginalis]SFV02988.1 Response regulator receiver domain-containing protein [Pseudomonas sp. OV546]
MSAVTSTILVVEDDAIVRMLIVDVLEELAFSVLEAADAAEALAIVENTEHVIDLMMTDVGLPDMDGKQLATKVRELRPTLPILFASGYAENIDVPAGMQVIAKPFSIDQLRDKVKSMLPAA